jgi:hypothetical protein
MKLFLALALVAVTNAPVNFVSGTRQETTDDRDMKAARTRVDERLKELNAQYPTVAPITDVAVLKLLPGHRVISVRFRQYPVAMLAPPPLKSQNLFFVPQKDPIKVVIDIAELEAQFRQSLALVKGDPGVKQAVRAWLKMSEELKQDGFYKFELVEDSIVVSRQGYGWKATGRTDVKSGGKGEFTVTLDFNVAGKLMRIAEKSTVMPGVRPICQATKLLDRDPIVRMMAEQDILVMGRAAKPYLDEQRAKASSELKKAINRIWKRILDEGW